MCSNVQTFQQKVRGVEIQNLQEIMLLVKGYVIMYWCSYNVVSIQFI